ncbi:hypothetical protein, partial [Salipiger marinus]|uniref:hypothetical protein n=1 Tax=Salipiger marinus TaxID=555512 RepID=UPI0040598226
MPDNGIRSTDLDTLSLADDLIANRDGNIGRMPVKSLAAPGLIVPLVYDTPAAAIASTEGERGPGRQWATREGLAYEELPASADPEDYDFLTPGGARLRVLTSGGELHLDSFGADPSGVAFSTMAFRAWLAAGERRGGGPMRATGLYVLGDPGDPETDDDAPACFAYQVPKSGRDSEFLLEGATLRFTAGTNKWAWRVYQHGNSALWKVPKIKGGTFECAGIVDPLGCFLWDDIGGGETKGTTFLGWKRSSGLESAVCIMQRNYSSWSENTSHKEYNVHDCDRFWESGKYTGPGSTATDSIARTDLDFGFADGAKSYLIVNKMGMYDSRIRRVKGNGQKIGIIRNDGAAVAYTVISDVSFEQGYEATSRATAEMTAGSNVLALSGGLTQFAEWMADGMRVRVSGAGTDGADLESWITGFTSNAEVTLAHPAATTVSGATSTTYATVVQEERSSLHPFTRGEGVTNRNNGRVFDDFRFTGADRSIRPSTFGALQA